MFKALGLALVAASLSAAADQPGTYIVQSSLDDPFCRHVQRILNAGEYPGNGVGRKPNSNFIDWNAVNVDGKTAREVAPEDLQKTDVDIDNDGQVDRVFRWKASLGGSKTPHLYIFNAQEGGRREQVGLNLRQLFQAPRQLYLNGSTWIQSVQKSYTRDWSRWDVTFISAMEILRHGTTHYVVAFDPQSLPSLSAEGLVVQLLPRDEAKGICMLRRVCPCDGCSDLRGRPTEQFLPSKQWCTRK